MRIGIEAQRIFRPNKHGMDIVAIELIRNLQLIDKTNQYYIFVKAGSDSSVINPTPNFTIIEMPNRAYPIWEQITLPKTINKYKLDLLHCTSNTAPLWLKTPLVLTLHDIIFMGKINLTNGTPYQRLGNLYRRLLVPNVIAKSTKILTVSNFERFRIKTRFNLPNTKINTVYNAINNQFTPITNSEKLSEIKIKYNLPENFVLFLGNTDPKKNIKNTLKGFLDANRHFNGSYKLVMPDITPKFLTKILKGLDSDFLKDKIVLTGYINNNELKYIYNLAKLFLYPSFYESFGIPILEAMACGTPVITSNVAAMPEVAGKAAIYVDPSSPTQISMAIRRVLTDDDLYRKSKKEGLEQAHAFNWEKTANQVLDIYQHIYTYTHAN